MRYRLEQARQCLDSAVRELDANDFKAAANRSYYCVFHAMRALLALDGFDSKKHSGIIAAFQKRYIKTAVFPSGFSDMVQDAFNNRGKSDYEDFFVLSKEETFQQIENAERFLLAIEDYCKTL
jgi:uncharacterized protein (UPF0332 family)